MPNVPLHVSAMYIVLIFGIVFIIPITILASSNRLGLPFNKKKKYLIAAFVGLLIWMVFTFIVAQAGLVKAGTEVAWLMALMLPPTVVIIGLLFSKTYSRLLEPIDNYWLIYAQAYRVIREFIFLLLFHYNSMPADMVFGGKNFDLLIGLSAPFIAYYSLKQKPGANTLVLIWNIVGILFAVNLAVVSFTSLQSATAGGITYNALIFSFPYVWIPAISIPFSLLLHLASIKKLVQNRKPKTKLAFT